jgi:hypothetical protein
VLRFGKLVECGFDEVTLEMVYVTSRRWENKMKKTLAARLFDGDRHCLLQQRG